MTTTPLIIDRHVGEVATFRRDNPVDVGAFVDLVAGCDFVSTDDFAYSVHIDPEELHVQVDFPSGTAPQVASVMLQDLFIAGSMAQEIEASEQGLDLDTSIDERFRRLVERFGESDETRERINFLGSSVIDVAEPDNTEDLGVGLLGETFDAEKPKLIPGAGSTAMILAARTGMTSIKADGKGGTLLTPDQRDDLRIGGRAMQQTMLAYHGDSEYTFKPF